MILRLAIGSILACGLIAAPEQDLEKQLTAAIHREVVVGDIKGAIEEFRAVIAQSNTNRSAAARALEHIAQCQEKLGDREAAKQTYAILARDYPDQATTAAASKAETAPGTVANPQPYNLNFLDGDAGSIPPSWLFSPGSGGSAELRRAGCMTMPSCVAITGASTEVVGNLMRSFDAAPYRGMTLRLRAMLKLDASDPKDAAQMWMRVDNSNRQVLFLDNMANRPVRGSAWTSAEIVVKIPETADSLHLGVLSVGKGRAWAEGMALEVVPDGTRSAAPPAFGYATGTFPVSAAAGKKVRFRGFIKTQDVTSGYAALWWRVDGQSSVLEKSPLLGVRGTTGWTPYQMIVDVPEGTRNINFGAMLAGTGTAWFDTLSVTLDGVPYLDSGHFDFDFEGARPVGFGIGGNGYDVQFDRRIFHDGSQSLRMKNIGGVVPTQALPSNGPKFGVATSTFPVDAARGKSIRFAGYIKTENVVDGYAGLWWRVDGKSEGKTIPLAFDNMQNRGVTGTSDWRRYEINLPVAADATNINFGAIFTGKGGTAWFDDLTVHIDGVPYLDKSRFDLDFESPTSKGFYTGGEGYAVRLDDQVFFHGLHSLRLQYVGAAQ